MKDNWSTSTSGKITGSTSSGISLGGNNREFQLMQHIEQITEIVHRQESEIRRLQGLLSQKNNSSSDFSNKELKFLLMRCHPDKNPESKMAMEVTQKLIKKKNK